VVLERNSVRKGFVNRATLGDLRKSLTLCFVEVTRDMNVTGDFLDEASIRNVAIFAVIGMHT
jgi:hypothetical protein